MVSRRPPGLSVNPDRLFIRTTVAFDVFVSVNPSSNRGTHSYISYIFYFSPSVDLRDDVCRNVIVQLVAGLEKIKYIYI